MTDAAHRLTELRERFAAHKAALEHDTELAGPWAEDILARYDQVDAKLVKRGFPPTSPWWRATIERFIRSGRPMAVLRVGRRGGKSSSLSRLAVVLALYGRHVVPPGDLGVAAIVSTDKGEALGRLVTIKAILDALGIAYRPSRAPKLGVELVDRPIEFRVFAATIKGVSGFTSVFVLCDEVAKWRDADTGVNPATTVLASIAPTMATQPNARMVLSSSPMGRYDAHFDAFERGETDEQIVAHAPTWIANPTLTEARTRQLEPDGRAHAREYRAIPEEGSEFSLLNGPALERARRTTPGDAPRVPGCTYVAAIDPATRGHAFTLAIGTRDPRGRRIVAAVREARGTPAAPLSPKAQLRAWKPLLDAYGVAMLKTDQWNVDSMQDSAIDLGLYLDGEPWTHATKAEAFEALDRLARDGDLELPRDEIVKTDLLGIRRKLTRTGITYELAEKDGRHSDHAASIAMMLMHAQVTGVAPAPPKTEEERQADQKAAFLDGLRKDRERRERFGAVPPTHAMRRGGR